MKNFNVYFTVQTDDNVTMGDIEKKVLEMGQVFNISIQAQSLVYPQTTMPPFMPHYMTNVTDDPEIPTNGDYENRVINKPFSVDDIKAENRQIADYIDSVSENISKATSEFLQNKDDYNLEFLKQALNKENMSFIVSSFKEDKVLISSGDDYALEKSFVNKAYEFEVFYDAVHALEKTLDKLVVEITEDESKAKDAKECYKIIKISNGHLSSVGIRYCIF